MKKMFKKFSFLLVALPLVAMSVSCSGDDDSSTNNNNGNNPQGHEVEYRVTIAEPVLTSISYTNAEGNQVAATETLEGLTEWSKTIDDVEAPFNAILNIEFESPAGSPKAYQLKIFVDGELAHSVNDMGSGMVDTDIQYEITE